MTGRPEDIYYTFHMVGEGGEITTATKNIELPRELLKPNVEYDVAVAKFSLDTTSIPDVVVPIAQPTHFLPHHDFVVPETFDNMGALLIPGVIVGLKRFQPVGPQDGPKAMSRPFQTNEGVPDAWIQQIPRAIFLTPEEEQKIPQTFSPGSTTLKQYDNRQPIFHMTAANFAQQYFGAFYSTKAVDIAMFSMYFTQWICRDFSQSGTARTLNLDFQVPGQVQALDQLFIAVPKFITECFPNPTWREVSSKQDSPKMLRLVTERGLGQPQQVLEQDTAYEQGTRLAKVPLILTQSRSPARGILITSNSLPISSTYVGVKGSGGGNNILFNSENNPLSDINTLPALAFFVWAESKSQNLDKVTFYSQNLRDGQLVHLPDASQEGRKLDIAVYWVDAYFNAYPLQLKSGETAIIQLAFLAGNSSVDLSSFKRTRQ